MLDRAPWGVAKLGQREGKQASSIVLSIVGPHRAGGTQKGFLIQKDRLRVTSYILFDASTQCTHCLHFGNHQARWKELPSCAICARSLLTDLHTCVHAECKIKGTTCLYTSMLCSNCSTEDNKGITKECPSRRQALLAQTNRNNSMGVDVTAH